ncbi:hypothetical protein [Streptosporangium pseudovulgare]|uniref:DUF11 domain-containing protein n=1 Tax=Streptosporangium pseudovulgare TaxID=35765 RepID=A0ABQ2R5A9_9ACTN|nr:hypothetical protein [Streptosporangium pseudovulgare]GGQ11049.1 hypothetical protein GCM10010140_46510 [Streptosporangium pseudovulgare]
MLHPISKIATLAVAAPLAGAMLFAAPATAASTSPAAASTASAASASKKADDPFSVFAVKGSASKKVRPGGKITYSLKATNTGPYESKAGEYYIVVGAPKGVDIAGKWSYYGPKKSACVSEDQFAFCAVDKTMKVGDSVSFTFEMKVKKSAKGTLKTSLGVLAFDVPNGAENLSREELERLGVKSWLYGKRYSTHVVR